jgi:hypothetical protein
MTELEECQAALAKIPEWGWLIDCGKSWLSIADVVKHYPARYATVRQWCEKGLIPAAMYESAIDRWRLPKSGLILCFGRMLARRDEHSPRNV